MLFGVIKFCLCIVVIVFVIFIIVSEAWGDVFRKRLLLLWVLCIIVVM